jgi:hypothetical protein
VLQKCANPACGAPFRYLHQGRLFEVEMQFAPDPLGGSQARLSNGKGRVERCWLCEGCARQGTLRLDRTRGVIMVSSSGRSEEILTTALLTPSVNEVTEIERVLIRPLDLDLNALMGRHAGTD